MTGFRFVDLLFFVVLVYVGGSISGFLGLCWFRHPGLLCLLGFVLIYGCGSISGFLSLLLALIGGSGLLFMWGFFVFNFLFLPNFIHVFACWLLRKCFFGYQGFLLLISVHDNKLRCGWPVTLLASHIGLTCLSLAI